MNRLCLTIACLSAVAWTQASAENLSSDPPKTPRPHAAKVKHLAAVQKSASLDEAVRFSDPYAPPEGTTVVKKRRPSRLFLSGSERPAGRRPVDRMGQDQGGHTTGGLKWGF